jgi:hypothetical protein
MPVKGVRIEVNMGGIGKKSEHPNKDDGKSKKPPPAPIEDDDTEDGDFATPKRDRTDGTDDQPL